MYEYFIHPSLKEVTIDLGNSVKFPKELRIYTKENEISLNSYEHIYSDVGYTFTQSHHDDAHIRLILSETDWLYEISVGGTIEIRSKSVTGLIKGTQAILKYLHKYGYLYKGVMRDKASLEEVGFHLDCARKYFSSSCIKSLIRRLSWMNFTHLELHFSENLGLRLDNSKHKNLLSEDFITHDELKEILAFAKKYHIEIIPSLDSPGHLKHILKKVPHLALKGSNLEALDISNDTAIEFLKGLYDDYLDVLNEQTIINLGADEFIDFETFDDYPVLERYAKEVLNIENGTGYDTYLHTINIMTSHLENKGYKVRVWNDGLKRTNQKANVILNDSVEICYWTQYNKHMAPLSSFENLGYTIINYHAENFYYTLHPEGGIKIIDPQKWYGKWHVEEFSFNQMSLNPSKIKGAYYSLWCDEPSLQDENEIMESLVYPLMAFSQSVWSGHGNIEFEQLNVGGVIGELV